MTSEGPGPAHAALVGTTASGKSALALEVCRRDPTWEIVSIDSMQVYRGMDIGTAKPTADEQAEVPHHLIDLVDPWEDFNVVGFRDAYDRVVADLEMRGKRALLVGGTGLHLRAVVDRLEFPGRYPGVVAELERNGDDTEALHRRLHDLDPIGASRMEPENRRRVLRALEVTLGSGRPFSSFGPGMDAYPEIDIALIGIRLPADVVRQRIADRFEQQLVAGFLEEVRSLHGNARGLSVTAAQALGYKELIAHLDGRDSLDEAVEVAIRRTRRFARRQRSWFRRDPRIRWIDTDRPLDAVDAVFERLNPLVVPGARLEDS